MTDIRPNILFVDDEEINLKIFAYTFKNDFTVYTANSAQNATEILKKTAINVIVTDYRMPEINGLKFIENIKATAPDKIFIMVTGYVHEIEDLNKEHIFRLLNKPWDKEILKKVIREALAQYEISTKNN